MTIGELIEEKTKPCSTNGINKLVARGRFVHDKDLFM